MRIIALRGGKSCGKTTTLVMVYNQVLSSGGISTAKSQAGGDPNDFYDLVTYKGKKVAFLTMGDFSTATINAIHHYNTTGVDVFVLASNTSFVKPIRLIMSFSHHLIQKTSSTPKNNVNNLIANTTDANTIFSLI